MQQIFQALAFKRGPALKNRFMLAPLTNSQSHDDGVLSDDEHHWLTLRAKGGFGSTMTCAAHVQACGQGFPGQLGIFNDQHLAGLTRLADDINKHQSVSLLQLHHAGMRSPKELIGGAPVCPSDNEECAARALTADEVQQLIEDFITAAVRAETAGFHGVEIHGAHGYILCQFLSAEINLRDDQYGGSLENRSRILFEIIDGIRARCSDDFIIGVRLSPERFGMQLSEALIISQRLMDEGNIEFLDMSLWDVFKEPVEEEFKGRSLMSYFTELNRGDTKLGVAGKISDPAQVKSCMDAGVDFVLLGRAAILHHDYPLQAQNDENFTAATLPVTAQYLKQQGLGPAFIKYMSSWKGFVEG